MPPTNELPQSGYLLEHLYANDVHLSVKHPEDNGSDNGQILFGWDWEIIDATSFEVRVKLGFDPSPERFEQVRLTLSGRFRVSADSPSVGFQDFVKLHAVAILFPYARELLSAVTARGFYGAMILPALNVVQLMQDKDPQQTTGARQLAAGKTIPGLPPAQPQQSAETAASGHRAPAKATGGRSRGRARKGPTDTR